MIARTLARQIGAELLKVRRRSLFHTLFVILCFFGVLPLALGVAAWRDPALHDWARGWLSFPGCLWNPLKIAQLLLPICVCVAAAALVGGDYAAMTWKMLLPRTRSRSSVLVARYLTALGLANGAMLVVALLAIACGFLGTRMIGVPFLSGAGISLAELLRVEAFYLLQFAYLSAAALCMVVLTRSLVGGTLLGLLVATLLGRMLVFLPFGSWISPSANLDYLEVRLLPMSRISLEEIVSALGHAPSLAASLAPVLGFTLLSVAVAIWLFERRDLASEGA